MPGQPFTRSHAHARFRLSPGDSPSRIASCHRHRRIRHSASPKASHVCAEITFKQIAKRRNGKTFPPCEETVDVETLLWSPEENRKEIAPASKTSRFLSDLYLQSSCPPDESMCLSETPNAPLTPDGVQSETGG